MKHSTLHQNTIYSFRLPPSTFNATSSDFHIHNKIFHLQHSLPQSNEDDNQNPIHLCNFHLPHFLFSGNYPRPTALHQASDNTMRKQRQLNLCSRLHLQRRAPHLPSLPHLPDKPAVRFHRRHLHALVCKPITTSPAQLRPSKRGTRNEHDGSRSGDMFLLRRSLSVQLVLRCPSGRHASRDREQHFPGLVHVSGPAGSGQYSDQGFVRRNKNQCSPEMRLPHCEPTRQRCDLSVELFGHVE